MAQLKVDVTYKPDKHTTAVDLRALAETLDSLIDTTGNSLSDVSISIEADYDDDTHVIAATWEV